MTDTKSNVLPTMKPSLPLNYKTKLGIDDTVLAPSILGGVNIKQNNLCHPCWGEFRITNITPDILERRDVSSSGSGFSFFLVSERQAEYVASVSC